MHPHANAFDNSAKQYEQGRPGYPRDLLEWIGSRGNLAPGCTVVDLGAGTGKLTRLLVESDARIIAIEPIAAMREEFSRILPETELLDATAETMPLADESVDMVICGQSIRWFATNTALAEIARVLRADGELVITFNRPDVSSPLQRRLSEILKEVDSLTDERKPGENWRDVLFANAHFELVVEVELPNHHVIDCKGLSDRLYSSSQFARLPSLRQGQLIAELESLAEGDHVELGQITGVLALRKFNIPDDEKTF